MRFRPLTQLCAIAIVALYASAAFADEPPPLVDIVATTNLDTGDHARKYAQALSTSASLVLGDLGAVTYGGDDDEKTKPTDGAARYRLLIEHRGSVSLGGQIAQTSNDHPLLDAKINEKGIHKMVDKARWQTAWSMKASQAGTLRFKLLSWDGRSYKELRAWDARIRDGHPEAATGTVQVATLVQSTAERYDRSPRCPIDVPAAKKAALEKLIPDDIGPDLVPAFVQGAIKKLKAPPPPAVDPMGMPADFGRMGERPDATAEVAIQNVSPWAIAGLTISVAYGDRRTPMVLEIDQKFEKPLAAGEKTTLRYTGKPMQIVMPIATLRDGVNIIHINFAPADAQK